MESHVLANPWCLPESICPSLHFALRNPSVGRMNLSWVLLEESTKYWKHNSNSGAGSLSLVHWIIGIIGTAVKSHALYESKSEHAIVHDGFLMCWSVPSHSLSGLKPDPSGYCFFTWRPPKCCWFQRKYHVKSRGLSLAAKLVMRTLHWPE